MNHCQSNGKYKVCLIIHMLGLGLSETLLLGPFDRTKTSAQLIIDIFPSSKDINTSFVITPELGFILRTHL